MQHDSAFSFEGDWPAVEELLGSAEALDSLARETGALVRRRHIAPLINSINSAWCYIMPPIIVRFTNALSFKPASVPKKSIVSTTSFLVLFFRRRI